MDARDKLLKTPLHLACLKGHINIAKLLISREASIFEKDQSGRTAMHFAMCAGNYVSAIELSVILTMNDATELVDMRDHSGRTPLHYAVFNTCIN